MQWIDGGEWAGKGRREECLKNVRRDASHTKQKDFSLPFLHITCPRED
jgi:hypothetical protein